MQKYHPQTQNAYVAPYAQVCNGHRATLDAVARILTGMGVGHHVSWPTPNGLSKKPYWRVLVNGLKRNKVFLDRIMPYLVTKHAQAEAVSKFIASREESYYKHLPYTQYEVGLVESVRQRERKGTPDNGAFADVAQRLHAGHRLLRA